MSWDGKPRATTRTRRITGTPPGPGRTLRSGRRRRRAAGPTRAPSSSAPGPRAGSAGAGPPPPRDRGPGSRRARGRGPVGRVGSQTRPSGPSGSSITIARRSGKSLPTTGVPTARLSNSLLGVDDRSFSVRGWLGIADTSAEATQSRSESGGTAGSTWSRPSKRASDARPCSVPCSGPDPMKTRWAVRTAGSSIASARTWRPRSRRNPPW